MGDEAPIEEETEDIESEEEGTDDSDDFDVKLDSDEEDSDGSEEEEENKSPNEKAKKRKEEIKNSKEKALERKEEIEAPNEKAEERKDAKSKKGRPVKEDKEFKYYPTSRCVPSQFKIFIDGLSEERKKAIAEMGFGGLLEFKIIKNRNQEVMELMRRFDHESGKLHVHKKELHLTEEFVHRILGLPIGREEIKLKRGDGGLEIEKGKNSGETVKKDGEKDTKRKRRTDVITELDGVVDEDEWKAKFIFLAFKYVLSPTSSNYLNNSSKLFEDIVSRAHDMKWCQLVMERLCEGVKSLKEQLAMQEKGKKATLYLKGCSLLLELNGQVFYVEHIDCSVMNTPFSEPNMPRLCDWTDQRIRKVYKKVKNFDRINVNLYHYNARCGPSFRFVTNENEVRRLKGVEEGVCTLKEAVTFIAASLKEEVKDLRQERHDLREVVNKLERSLEEKVGNEGRDCTGIGFDAGNDAEPFKLGDFLNLNSPLPHETLGENDVRSPCERDKENA